MGSRSYLILAGDANTSCGFRANIAPKSPLVQQTRLRKAVTDEADWQVRPLVEDRQKQKLVPAL